MADGADGAAGTDGADGLTGITSHAPLPVLFWGLTYMVLKWFMSA